MKLVRVAAGFVLSEDNYEKLKLLAEKTGGGRLFKAFIEPVERIEMREIFREVDPEIRSDFRRLTEWRGMK